MYIIVTNVLEHVVYISNTLVHIHDSYQVRSSLSLFQKCHLSLYSLFFFPKHGNTPKCYSSADNIFFLYFTETKHINKSKWSLPASSQNSYLLQIYFCFLIWYSHLYQILPFTKIKSWTLNEAAGKKGVKQLVLGVFPYSIYNGTKYK